MDNRRRTPRVVRGLLGCGIAVPFLYYGIQIAAAPFFPGFSFAGTTASELGSDLSTAPSLFNAGIMVQGVASLLAALGYFLALRRLGEHPVLAVLVSAVVALNGVQTLWAGFFPMPDPRHGGHPVFIAGLIALPVLLAVVLWKRSRSGRLKAYLVLTLLLLLAMVPIMSGASGLDTHTYRGLVQRIFTLAIFPPIGVGAYVLARRLREEEA